MENKPNPHKDKPSIRERIANIIVIVLPAASKPEAKPKKPDKPVKSGFDLIALILKILGTLIALFKLFK